MRSLGTVPAGSRPTVRLALCLVTLGLLAPIVAIAGDCWGCRHRQCEYGFLTGAFGCAELEAECSLIARLTGNCAVKTCVPYGICVEGKLPVPRLPDEPDTKEDDREPRPEGDDASLGLG